MQFETNNTLVEDHVVTLANSSIDYLTALAIVDNTTIGDQVRSGISVFVSIPGAGELTDEEMALVTSKELRRPARVLLPVNLLESLERISTERELAQDHIIDVALQRYIGLRLAHPLLVRKLTRRD